MSLPARAFYVPATIVAIGRRRRRELDHPRLGERPPRGVEVVIELLEQRHRLGRPITPPS